MVNTEVQAHKQANAALQVATGEQVKLKGEVQDLSAQLTTALDRIHNMSMDLATIWSLLDAEAQVRRQQDAGGASTSKGQIGPTLWSMLKVKMIPSVAGSRTRGRCNSTTGLQPGTVAYML